MILCSLLRKAFPSGQGSFWLREAWVDFIQVAVSEAICQALQPELQDSFKHNIGTKQKPDQIYNLLDVFTLKVNFNPKLFSKTVFDCRKPWCQTNIIQFSQQYSEKQLNDKRNPSGLYLDIVMKNMYHVVSRQFRNNVSQGCKTQQWS